MAKETKPALVGDANQGRAEWLRELLDRQFGVESVTVRCFDELLELVRRDFDPTSPSGLRKYSLILMADNLPRFPSTIGSPEVVKGHFRSLNEIDKVDRFLTVLISSGQAVIDFRGGTPPKKEIPVNSSRRSKSQYQGCIRILNHFGGLERIISARLHWDGSNRILREQIRALSDRRDLSEGESCLKELISRCLDCTKLKPIKVMQLGQGKSGAHVFRILVDRGKRRQNEYLVKLCRAESIWKLKSEVRGHLQASPTLTHPGYLVNLPILQKAHVPTRSLDSQKQPNQHIVGSGCWYAIFFDFVGGEKFGSFIDLETALLESADELEKITANTSFSVSKLGDSEQQRTRILETVLDWLCDNWYANSKGIHLRREERQIWLAKSPDDEQTYPIMPPYQLTARTRGWIQSFLDGREGQLGERFFPDWADYAYRVLRLVSDEKPSASELGQLGRRLPVLMTHVHGDLNASNILLWLEKKHPFLIDFPFYQDAGHALQDFARLEVEIKLGLIDRQKDSSPELKAYEYTYTQMPIWQTMEDRLLGDWNQAPLQWPQGTYTRNVRFCFGLIQLLRIKAHQVQANPKCPGLPPTDFTAEYLPALLYHTVRAIGFPSLSIFKRLFAVYSSGLMLRQLDAFSDNVKVASPN